MCVPALQGADVPFWFIESFLNTTGYPTTFAKKDDLETLALPERVLNSTRGINTQARVKVRYKRVLMSHVKYMRKACMCVLLESDSSIACERAWMCACEHVHSTRSD